jgi:hypothetical protein
MMSPTREGSVILYTTGYDEWKGTGLYRLDGDNRA